MLECQLVHKLERCTEKDRRLAARLQPATSTQFAELFATSRICTSAVGDAGMRKASTRMPEQGTQAPPPAPDLIPAKQLTENLHKDWNSERGHITVACKERHYRD